MGRRMASQMTCEPIAGGVGQTNQDTMSVTRTAISMLASQDVVRLEVPQYRAADGREAA
jgi:hypothetical protein